MIRLKNFGLIHLCILNLVLFFIFAIIVQSYFFKKVKTNDAYQNKLLHLHDLEQIKFSILNELKILETKRSIYLDEMASLKYKIKLSNQSLNEIKEKIEISKVKIENHSIKIYDLKNEIDNKANSLQAYKSIFKNIPKDIIEMETETEWGSIESCLNLTQCHNEIKFYLHDPLNIVNEKNSLLSSYDLTEDPKKACFIIILIPSDNLIDKFLIEYSNKTNYLFIIKDDKNTLTNSIRTFRSQFNDSNLEKVFKCSFYASFNRQTVNSFFYLNFGLISLEYDQLIDADLMSNRPYLLYSNKEDSNVNFIKKIYENVNDVFINSNLKVSEHYSFLLKSKFTILTSFSINDLIDALRCATVPIIFDLDYKLPLSDLIAWDDIVIRIPFQKINSLRKILDEFTKYDLVNRRLKSRMIFNSYFKSIETQLKTILAALLDKIGLSSNPIKVYKSSEYIPKFLYQEKFNFVHKSINEYLGELNQSKLDSNSFKNNYTQSKYKIWNYIYYPFNMFPSDPFFINYLSESNFLNSNENYGGGDGKKFHSHLSGNYEKFEQFTIVILCYDRETILLSYLETYFKSLPYLNSILIVWNSINKEPNWILWSKFSEFFLQNRLKILKMGKNSLNNRFLPFDLIKTDAVLGLDDDVLLRADEIVFAFRVWRENRDRIVGFPARYHSYNSSIQSFMYYSYLSCEYSMVLTGAAFYHRFYNYYYSHIIDSRVRDKVDELMNCEDIGFNMMVAHLIRKPPIKVTTKYNFYCWNCENLKNNSPISLKEDHYSKRSECLKYFINIFGYNPLLYSQFRADSVLYKTKLAKNEQRCFQLI